MALNQPLSAILRMHGDHLHLEITCPNHKTVGEVAYAVQGTKVLLLCPQGCPLGEWDDEKSYKAEFRELGLRLKSLYFDVPPQKK